MFKKWHPANVCTKVRIKSASQSQKKKSSYNDTFCQNKLGGFQGAIGDLNLKCMGKSDPHQVAVRLLELETVLQYITP